MQNYDKPENLDSAVNALQEALRLDGNFGLAFAALGETFWRKYDTSKDATWLTIARNNCLRALELNPASAASHACQGAVENATGNYEEAAKQFQAATLADPSNDNAYLGLANAFDHLGDSSRAEQTYLQAIKIRPNYWAVYGRLGAYYVSRGRYSEAEKMFKQVVALTPDSYRGYSNLGGVYLYQRRDDEALTSFQKSLALKPNYFAASNLGTLLFLKGESEKAIRAFQEALRIDPTNYTVWANIASVYKRMDDTEHAKDAYGKAASLAEQAANLNPRDAKVLADLASLYISLGKGLQAPPLLIKALRMAPENTRVLFIAATAYLDLGQRQEAFNVLEQALDRGLPLKDIQESIALAPLKDDPRYAALQRRAAPAVRKAIK